MKRSTAPGGTIGHLMRTTSGFRALRPYGAAFAVVVVAAIVRSFIWLNSDVSWLLTLGEQVLAGARAYVDFSEPNPPASILLYMPATLLGQLTAVPAELALTVLVFAGALLSLWLFARILASSTLLRPQEWPLLLAFGCAALLILPGDNFAERENIALIAMLPMLAVYAVRASNMPVGGMLAMIAGIGGGIAVAIKPYFALALLLPLLYGLWSLRSDRRKLALLIFSPEHLAAGAVLASYAVVLIALFADYVWHTLPLVLTLYVPLRYSLPYMLANPSVLLIVMTALVSVAIGRGEFRSPLIRVTALAALGFAVALIVQGKGWPYHGYPAVALSLLLLCLLLLRRWFGAAVTKAFPLDLAVALGLFACIFGLAAAWLLQEPSRAKLVVEVARLAPDRPKVLSIYGSPGIAFPLTRKLRGTPIGRTPFQWISAYTDRFLSAGQLDPAAKSGIHDPALRRRIAEYGRRDRFELADTIRTRRPDVILIGDKGERHWAFSHPEIAQVLRRYRLAETFDGVEIWLPRDTAKMTAP